MVAQESVMLPLGTAAPSFSLPDPASSLLTSLDDVAGTSGTLVAFMCNHCPYVRHIARRFGEQAAVWAGLRVSTVAVNSNDADAYPDDAPPAMAAQARLWGWDFPYLVDVDQEVAKAYRAACTPDFFLFDADRILVYRGRFDAARPGNDAPVTGAELDAAIRAVAGGSCPDAGQRPSMGCSIKWRPGNAP